MSGQIHALTATEFVQGERADYELSFFDEERQRTPNMTGAKVVLDLFVGGDLIVRKSTPAQKGIDDTKAAKGIFTVTMFPDDIPTIDATKAVTARVWHIDAADVTAKKDYRHTDGEGPAVIRVTASDVLK